MKYLIILLIAFSVAPSFGQQESQYLNTINNPYILNPAAGGMANVIQIEATSRSQWLGYNGGPRTLMLMGNSPIKFKKGGDNVISEYNVEDKTFFSDPEAGTGKMKHVVGGRVSNDVIGPFAKTSAYGSYAIHLPFTKGLNFGVGIGLGWSNFRINQDRVILYQEDDAAYSQFLGNSSQQNIIDANAGIVFYNNNFVGGLSVLQVLKNNAVFGDVATNSYYNRHFFLTAKYRFDLENSVGIEPLVVGKFAEKSPSSFDVGLQFSYNRAAWLGIQYRTSNAIVIQVGANIVKNLYLRYGYEIATGKIRTGTSGTHEVQLGIYLGKNRNMKKEIKGKSKAKTEEKGH